MDLLVSRISDVMDIVTDPVPDSYYKREEDPSLYVSSSTGRGPLSRTWCSEYREACFGAGVAQRVGGPAQHSPSPTGASTPSPTHSQHVPDSDSGLESNNASVESALAPAAAAPVVGQVGGGGGREKQKFKEKHFMCSYKVVRINLAIWGLQTRGEAWTETGTQLLTLPTRNSAQNTNS